jgi:hypothetical protein
LPALVRQTDHPQRARVPEQARVREREPQPAWPERELVQQMGRPPREQALGREQPATRERRAWPERELVQQTDRRQPARASVSQALAPVRPAPVRPAREQTDRPPRALGPAPVSALQERIRLERERMDRPQRALASVPPALGPVQPELVRPALAQLVEERAPELGALARPVRERMDHPPREPAWEQQARARVPLVRLGLGRVLPAQAREPARPGPEPAPPGPERMDRRQQGLAPDAERRAQEPVPPARERMGHRPLAPERARVQGPALEQVRVLRRRRALPPQASAA